jgi:hypothetical protein
VLQLELAPAGMRSSIGAYELTVNPTPFNALIDRHLPWPISGADKQENRHKRQGHDDSPKIYAGLVLTFALTLSGGAEGRHWHWYRYLQFGNAGIADYARDERSDRRTSSQRGGPLTVLMAQFIHDCQGQAFEPKNFLWPQSLRPSIPMTPRTLL